VRSELGQSPDAAREEKAETETVKQHKNTNEEARTEEPNQLQTWPEADTVSRTRTNRAESLGRAQGQRTTCL